MMPPPTIRVSVTLLKSGKSRQVLQDIWSTAMVRDHQPGEAVFRSILPEDIDWKSFPAFPPSARLAVLVGEPIQAGPYVVRVKVPSGVKLMPHSRGFVKDNIAYFSTTMKSGTS
jgi:hypothetical protein